MIRNIIASVVKADKFCFFITMLFIFFLMFYLNVHSPLLTDDYCSAMFHGQRIVNFQMWYDKMVEFYFTWGGGVLGNGVNHFFLMYDKIYWNLANSLVFVFLVYALYLHVVGDFHTYRPSVLIVILFCLFSFVPAFGENFLWVVGASSYLWGTVAMLLYLIPLRFQFEKDKPIINSPLFAVFYGIVGIFASWWMANSCLAMCAIIVFCWIISRRVHFWEVCSLIGCIAGSCFLLLAPGGFARIEDSGAYQNSFILSAISNLIPTTLALFDIQTLFPLLFAVVLYYLYTRYFSDRVCLFALASLAVSHYSMIAAPYYPDRAKIVPIVFGIIIFAYVINKLLFEVRVHKVASIAISAVLPICIISSLFSAKGDFRYFEIDHLNRIAYIEQEKEKGNLDVVVDPPYVSNSKYCVGYRSNVLDTDPDNWVNNKYAPYYGIRSIRVKSAQ